MTTPNLDNLTHHMVPRRREKQTVLVCSYCKRPASELGPDATSAPCSERVCLACGSTTCKRAECMGDDWQD
jgi:hypothetical protein